MIEEIPVLKIGPILMVTIQFDLHDRLAEELQSALLKKLKATGALAVLIDITVLQIVDSFIGRVLSETARMARIMNAKVVLVGMRPAVALTLLEMGLELTDIDSAMDVESGLEKLGYELRKMDRDERESNALDHEEQNHGDD